MKATKSVYVIVFRGMCPVPQVETWHVSNNRVISFQIVTAHKFFVLHENVYQIETWAADRKHCKHCMHCKPTVPESPGKASKAAGDSDWDGLHKSHSDFEFELCSHASHLSHFAALRTWTTIDEESSYCICISCWLLWIRDQTSSHASHVTFWIDSMPQRKCQEFLGQKTLLKILNSEIWKAKMESFKSSHVSGPFQFRSAASRSVPEVCDSFEKIQS